MLTLKTQLDQLMTSQTKQEMPYQWIDDLLVHDTIGICLWSGPEYVYVFANHTYLRRSGKRDALGKPIRDVFQEHEIPGLLAILDQTYMTGERHIVSEALVYLQNQETGEYEDAWFYLVYNPVCDDQDNVIGVSHFAIEITEQVKSRQLVEYQKADIERLNARLAVRIHQLQESERRFQMFTENARDIIFRSRIKPTIACEYISPAVTAILGYTPEEYYADPLLPLKTVHPEDRSLLEQLMTSPEAFDQPVIIRHICHGREVALEQRHHLVFNQVGEPIGIEGIIRDVTEHKQIEQQLLTLAYTDTLTGLANRNRLYKEGEQLIAQVREQQQELALIYLDIDRFKRINTNLGHDTGDQVLIWTANRLRRCLTDPNCLFRLSGDDFALLLPNTTLSQAMHIAHAMIREVQHPCTIDGETIHLDISIGIAVSTGTESSFGTLLTHANIAMYQAKQHPENIQCYDPILHPLQREHLRIERELRCAIEHQELTLYYQPIVNLRDQSIVMLEALLRWHHPQRGLIAPSVFLPVAEEARLLAQIDQLVIAQALVQAAKWHAAGYDVTVAINMTAQSFQNPNLVASIVGRLKSTGVSATRVVLELTEHTAMQNMQRTREVLNELRQLGLRIALDDFGSGYASLKYLDTLPVDVLKLDRDFAAGIGQHGRTDAMVQALLLLGRGINMDIVVEGIEHEYQLDWLRQQHHDVLVQGYCIGRPQPAKQLMLSRSGSL
ncbi:MAG: EAL domain-containing protein [Chloroflexaceae bacterium]|nr:EAL domain-containing protein [Chloroflexaceae bacterium]